MTQSPKLGVGTCGFVYGTLREDVTHETLSKCVGNVDRFLAISWRRRAELVRKASSTNFSELLSLAEVAELISSRGMRGDQIRLVAQGRPVSVHSFTGWGNLGNSPVKEMVKSANVYVELARGSTVVLDDVSEYSPSVRAACQDIARSLGSPTQASVYITPPGQQGLKPHQDEEHVLVLQLHGRKRWRIGEAGDQDVLDAVLQPGDCLYVPAHTTHVAESLSDSTSVHLTVGICVASICEVLQRLIGEIAEVSELRREADRDPIALKDDLRIALSTISDILDAKDCHEIAAEMEAVSWSGRSGPVPISLAGDLSLVDGGVALQLRPDALIRIRRVSESSAEVAFGSRRLMLPWPAARKLLELDPDGFKLGNVLGDAARTAARELSRLLVAEGIAVPAKEAVQ